MFDNSQYYTQDVVAFSHSKVRSNFIKKTYLHLAFAILAFLGINYFFYVSGISFLIVNFLFQMPFAQILVLLLFVAVSFLAQWWASNVNNKLLQYSGLLLFILMEAVVMTPLLFMAINYADSSVLFFAGILTGVLFLALTFFAFLNQTDFSFLRSFLMFGGLLALVIVVCGAIFNFSLGLWFSGAMILFAGGSILYDTSNVIHHYREDQYVAASLNLFASVALLFFYILRFLLQFSSRD